MSLEGKGGTEYKKKKEDRDFVKKTGKRTKKKKEKMTWKEKGFSFSE